MPEMRPLTERLPVQGARDDSAAAAAARMHGPAVAEAKSRAVSRDLHVCLDQELENLRRLLRYRGLETTYAGEMRSVEQAVHDALEAGSRFLSLSALRTISALTAELNRELTRQAASRDRLAALA